MAAKLLPGPSGDVNAIEYSPAVGKRACSFVLLLPGTSIRPGPGADVAAKYSFGPKIDGIYRSLGQSLSGNHSIPVLQLCWRRFPADGGTTHDAIHDILAGVRHMRANYGQYCSAVIVGYSFGGAAIWALLAQCCQKAAAVESALGEDEANRHLSWIHGLVCLSGALKGTGEDNINLFSALQFLEKIKAPLLIVHGNDDDNVAVSAAHKAYRKAASLKTLCILEGAEHNLREPHWRHTVADVLSNWVVQVAMHHGVSNASRARAKLQAHHSAAVALGELSVANARVKLAFDPTPQHPLGGCLPAYHAYEVPTIEECFAERRSQSLNIGNGGARIMESMREDAPEDLKVSGSRATLADLCALHAERQRRARDHETMVRKGPTAAAYSKLIASRERRSSDWRGRQLTLRGSLASQGHRMVSDGSHSSREMSAMD